MTFCNKIVLYNACKHSEASNSIGNRAWILAKPKMTAPGAVLSSCSDRRICSKKELINSNKEQYKSHQLGQVDDEKNTQSLKI